MASLDFLLSDLVTANRILSREGVVDGLGHISVRHPDRPDRFFMSRARAPECIELQDIMEFEQNSPGFSTLRLARLKHSPAVTPHAT